MTPEIVAPCPVCGIGPASGACSVPYGSGNLLHCAECDHYWIAGASTSARGTAVQREHFGAQFANREDFFHNLYQGMNARRAIGGCRPEPGASVLEVGPGSGHLMDLLARRGCHVIGLDLSEAVVDAIRTRFSLTVLSDSLANCANQLGEEHFDLVLMCHVVEHFSDPLAELVEVRRLLKKGARAYFAVPNMRSWHARFRGWNGYEPYHLQYFTPASLRRLCERVGFEVEREGSWEGLTAWSNTVQRGLVGARRKSLAPAMPQGMPWRVGVRQVLETARLCVGIATTPVRWMQAWLGAGEELILVARKV